jgi:hypothetical protein
LRVLKLWNESMPHEKIFAAYIAFTLARIVAAEGIFSTRAIVYAAAFCLVAAGVFFSRAASGERGAIWAWRARLAIYPALTVFLFVHLRWVSPVINDGKRDAVLWAFDEAVAGGSLSVALEKFISPRTTEILSFCYLFFFVYLAIASVSYMFSEKHTGAAFYAGLFGVYAIGFFGYTLVPAVGPYMAYADRFSVPLAGYYCADFLAAFYSAGTNYTDIFPSLHCAASAFVLLFDKRRNRTRFWLCAAPVAGIWLSTIYLRYHYFADALAGAALAAAGLWIADKEEERKRGGL